MVAWAYKASKVTDYLSIGVLLAHLILAVAHIAYVLITHHSSSTWDSQEEMLALALTSQPPSAMADTCAGIERFGTMEHVVRVRALRACTGTPAGGRDGGDVADGSASGYEEEGREEIQMLVGEEEWVNRQGEFEGVRYDVSYGRRRRREKGRPDAPPSLHDLDPSEAEKFAESKELGHAKTV